jgi:GNAT superfamily N-acetyltransferase
VIGFVLAEPIREGFVSSMVNKDKMVKPALCGINRVWVSPLHRKRGIGMRLLESVRYHSIHTWNVESHYIIFFKGSILFMGLN